MIRLGSGPHTAAMRSRVQHRNAPLTAQKSRAGPLLVAERYGAASQLGWSALLLVLAATTYNTVLALANARGIYIGLAVVMLAELAVLGAGLTVVIASGLRPLDSAPLLFLGFFLADALLVSLLSGALTIDMARNVALIAIFVMLGARISEGALLGAFRITALLVTTFLILEIASVQYYIAALQPAQYFEQTRGISRREFDELGLFGNALGFEGRFAILNITGHRTASIFLEQVSLGNFAVVLSIFLATLWRRLSRPERLSYIALIALILVTNNSRAALGLILAAPLAYLMAPRLNRHAVLLILPMALIAAWIVVANTPPNKEDTLIGRLGLTVHTLSVLDLPAMLGSRAQLARHFADVGYAYVICTASVFGALALWLFVSLILPGHRVEQKRLGFLIALYLFATLLISGTSVFSIKTAALLWLLVGYARAAFGPDLNAAAEAAAGLPTIAPLQGGRPLRAAGGQLPEV